MERKVDSPMNLRRPPTEGKFLSQKVVWKGSAGTSCWMNIWWTGIIFIYQALNLFYIEEDSIHSPRTRALFARSGFGGFYPWHRVPATEHLLLVHCFTLRFIHQSIYINHCLILNPGGAGCFALMYRLSRVPFKFGCWFELFWFFLNWVIACTSSASYAWLCYLVLTLTTFLDSRAGLWILLCCLAFCCSWVRHSCCHSTIWPWRLSKSRWLLPHFGGSGEV